MTVLPNMILFVLAFACISHRADSLQRGVRRNQRRKLQMGMTDAPTISAEPTGTYVCFFYNSIPSVGTHHSPFDFNLLTVTISPTFTADPPMRGMTQSPTVSSPPTRKYPSHKGLPDISLPTRTTAQHQYFDLRSNLTHGLFLFSLVLDSSPRRRR